MALPSSWSDLYARWRGLFAVDDMEVEEWFREALEATRGVESLRDLTPSQRAVFFQKASGVLLALEEEPGELAFIPNQRTMIAAAFAKYTGAVLDGPPWRLSPAETGRPTKAEWVEAALASASFDTEGVPV